MADLVKEVTALDLALRASRNRFSSVTKFVHGENPETIPVYENFCFALALLREKLAASVLEAKELFSKLFAFQEAEGNFPIYLHDYPRAYDPHMGLKIAPILIHAIRTNLLGSDLIPLVEKVLEKTLQKEPTNPFWMDRYHACKGEEFPPKDTIDFSPIEWANWITTNQLVGNSHFNLPMTSEGFVKSEVQEGFEPRPTVLDWLINDKRYSQRLIKDHPFQIQLGALFPITYTPKPLIETSVRILWQGKTLHSFVGPGKHFKLDTPFEPSRKDLFEVAFYADLSPETQVLIEGKKGTYFSLGETINVITPQKQIDIRFERIKGEGEFSGHIFPGNRPSQILKGSAYDWQIGLRTLRRSDDVEIEVTVTSPSP